MYLWILWGTLLAVVLYARFRHNKFYATFLGIVLGVCAAVWSGLFNGFVKAGVSWIWLVYALQLATFTHFLALTRASLRPIWYRSLISLPGSWFSAATWLAVPWALIAAFGVYPYGWWLPYAICLLGLFQSLTSRKEDVGLLCGDVASVANLQRCELASVSSLEAADGTILRIAQIADPHLGPFMSPERLRRICERAVEAKPDLILITGDLLTMESNTESEKVNWALAPLASYQGKVFGCLGNHDHEAPETILSAYASIDATLLVDRSTMVETKIGPVEIIGANFVYRERKAHLEGLFAAIGETAPHPRILMLHDPTAFKHVPEGAADLTLSGHTHGGHVGLQSLGIAWTLVGAFTRAPDFGFWAKGQNRLYVHRGNGHYGYPLRLGVSGEESILHVQFST